MFGPSTTMSGQGTATDPFTFGPSPNTVPFPVPQFRPPVVATPTFGLPPTRIAEIRPFTFGQTPLSLPISTSGKTSPACIFRLYGPSLTPALTPTSFSFSSFSPFGQVQPANAGPIAPPTRRPKILDLTSDANTKLYNRLRHVRRGKAMRIPNPNPSAKHYIREYDILKTSNGCDQVLFFVAKRNRKLVAIRLERALLPEDALPFLKEEHVRTLADFLRIYGLSYAEIDIFGIRVNDQPLFFATDPRVTYEPGNFEYNRVFGTSPAVGFSFSGRI